MGTRTTSSENVVAIMDSVTGWAFGPTFGTEEQANDFLDFAARDGGRDVRTLTSNELDRVYQQWLEWPERVPDE